MMEGKFRSLNFKIWRIITTTIIIFLGMALFFNITVIKKIEKEFVFDHLIEAAHIMKSHEKIFSGRNRPLGPPTNNSIGPAEIQDFKIVKNRDNGYDIMAMEPFRRNFKKNQENDKDLEGILDHIIKNKNNKGTIKKYNMMIFYYVDWGNEGSRKPSESGTVFFTSLPKKSDLETGLFLGIIFMFIISFFVSKIIAKKIATPVQELKLFSEEISKRNWKVKAPKVENDEIGLLTKALEEMRDSLKMYEERDRQFLQSTSHDLKTPVMIIKGYAQSIIDGITVNSEQSGAEVIKSEAERLERKITQLLKLNTLSHSLEYSDSRENIRIDRIFKSLTSKFKVVKPELNWIVILKEIEIQGDSEALLIAFENIIENQLRFAETSISVVMKAGEKNEIIISNDGPQFEVEDPNILFETYTKDKLGKFGLGLSIVKQVIRSHNGTIEAYNTEKGVEFKIII